MTAVDSKPADLPCRTLSILCSKLGVTLDEVSLYLENFKRLENKSVDWLRPKIEEEERLSKMVGHARGVNSTESVLQMRKIYSLILVRSKQLSKQQNTKLAKLTELGN